MTYRYRTAAQISTYPLDYPHAAHLLAHQIRVWAPMVERVVVTIDTYRSRSGRYRGNRYDENLRALRELALSLRGAGRQVDVIEVDYSPEARREVARAFFGQDDMPAKAWDGGPFYAYFYGLHHAEARYVAHFDGDMLFGGGSRTWMDDAIRCMEADPDVLLTGPFPGPPRPDFAVFGHGDTPPRREQVAGNAAYRFQFVSTRIFMMDMARLRERVGTLPLYRPNARSRLKSILLGNPPDVIEAERLLGRILRERGLYRVDMLGAAPGLWSLHPPYRGPNFYGGLPRLVEAVESGHVPAEQRGHYDVHDSLVDWSSERLRTRRHKRLLRLLKDRLGGFA
ncbi:glycosyltransferase family 2 protein [Cupriavidus malaysiensis]|uniref:Capsular biosynthesis protein n=1 Tax=Cupriavidus malaysiensis TaxID=367825 RepID=A0ABM6F1U6_9BURK|nr:glycosyltransferase family 2 protein [Cupriavidus malaysiensis]AOZ05368.1 capsular biosynthesis protein [Cupriavidus malaysiensis]